MTASLPYHNRLKFATMKLLHLSDSEMISLLWGEHRRDSCEKVLNSPLFRGESEEGLGGTWNLGQQGVLLQCMGAHMGVVTAGLYQGPNDEAWNGV